MSGSLKASQFSWKAYGSAPDFSLIENYGLLRGLLLLKRISEIFSEKTGMLLEPAKRRLILEHKEAEQAADETGHER